MKGIKWVSGVLSVMIATSLMAFPQITDAKSKLNLEDERMNAKKRQIMVELEQHEAKTLASMKKSSAGKKSQIQAMENATSATYAGSIEYWDAHVYSFEVAEGGTLNVETNLSADQYEIVNLETDEIVANGETIAPGYYQLLVFGLSETPASYQVKLSGFAFMGTPDTSLPALNITSPAERYVRTNKGQKSITIAGSVTGSDFVEYQINFGTPVSLPASFNKQVAIEEGYSRIDFYTENEAFNAVYKLYYVLSPGVERIAGADRYATSAEISKRQFVDSDTVVIATGTNFPDALSGGALAAFEWAPILLTKPTGLTDPVKQEIKRRQASRAIILGGEGVVSSAVVNELKSLGVTTIERKAGVDRYATSASIAQSLLDRQTKEFGSHTDTAIVATGLNYADALAASSPAGWYGMPILLVKGSTIPAAIENVIKKNGLKNFIIIGGEAVVPSSAANKLASYGGQVYRVAGSDRYKTALEVAKVFTNPENSNYPMDPFVEHVAYGQNYPDALAQGPLASAMGAPLLLTKTYSLDPSVASFLSNVQPDVFYISGGTSVVSQNVENQLKSYIPQ